MAWILRGGRVAAAFVRRGALDFGTAVVVFFRVAFGGAAGVLDLVRAGGGDSESSSLISSSELSRATAKLLLIAIFVMGGAGAIDLARFDGGAPSSDSL